ncbi:17207_t:CDS:10 [Acaulospora colombiana]|uniref:17207_t:CDS:1 n=1 Tax=Acaulospora colombiana TaxID=27376 RepID=A0ACA9LLW5_9GLOM|nr:17207_t:CDS:10 [Acaulospora colombiana]
MSTSVRPRSGSQGQNGNNNEGNQVGEPQQQQRQETQSVFQSIIQVIFRIMIAYWIVSQSNQPSTPPPIINVPPGVDIPQNDPTLVKPKNLYPSWPLGCSMDLRVYISEKEYFTKFDDPSSLVWHASNIHYGDWKDERENYLEIQTSAAVRNNGSLYAHIFLTLEKATPNPFEPGYQDNMIVYTRELLTRYLPKRKTVKTKNLIRGSGEDEETEEDDTSVGERQIVSYWNRNLTLNIVSDYAVIPYHQLPSSITPVIPLDTSKYIDPNTQGGYYLPVLFANNFWDTSWMILIGQGVSVAIEVWKIKKAVDIENSFLPYTIRFVDKHKLSESEEKTKEYDRIAFIYLSRIAYPLLAGDDVIFFVYLYQRWVYPTDNKRANEYGQVEDDEPNAEEKSEQKTESKKDK